MDSKTAWTDRAAETQTVSGADGRAGGQGDRGLLGRADLRLSLDLVKQRLAIKGTERKEDLLDARCVFVFSIEPAHGHVENLGNLAHQLEIRRVFASLVLVHPGAC